MRIISLHPDATDWLVAFGAGNEIVGRTHRCTALEEHVVVVTRNDEATVRDEKDVPEVLRTGTGPFSADWKTIASLDPDLIVTEIRHESGWISLLDVENGWKELTGKNTVFFPYRPQILKQVMDLAIKLGKAAERLREALDFCSDIEIKIKRMQIEYGYDPKRLKNAPRVAGFVSVEPPVLGGGWLPDLVEWAGGVAIGVKQGRPDNPVTMEEVRAEKPDYVLLASDKQTTREIEINLAGKISRLLKDTLDIPDRRRFRAFGSEMGLFRTGPGIYETIPVIAAWIHSEDPAEPRDADEGSESQNQDAL